MFHTVQGSCITHELVTVRKSVDRDSVWAEHLHICLLCPSIIEGSIKGPGRSTRNRNESTRTTLESPSSETGADSHSPCTRRVVYVFVLPF